jgi:hypothetical protein
MPLPLAIAGIPWLATVFSSLFAGLIVFFVKLMGKRFALTAAFVTGSLVLFSVMFTVIFAAMTAIRVALPPEFGLAMATIIPGNVPACLGAYLTARTARWIYDWNTRVLQFRLNF